MQLYIQMLWSVQQSNIKLDYTKENQKWDKTDQNNGTIVLIVKCDWLRCREMLHTIAVIFNQYSAMQNIYVNFIIQRLRNFKILSYVQHNHRYLVIVVIITYKTQELKAADCNRCKRIMVQNKNTQQRNTCRWRKSEDTIP